MGRYVLGERVGAGGMGTVYRARDEQLQRDVAVKLIPLPPAPLVERAIREARAMAGIVHPNVVEVFDVGVTQTELYIVMRLFEGHTLRTWAAEDRDLASLLRTLLAAGEGLAAAHAAGFIHHDFKPDNVLVADDGRVAVTDFGLAALAQTSPETDDDGQGTTEDGAIGGTRGYASPERLAGDHGDARSDQFSWCVTAYELLYGACPEVNATAPSRPKRSGVGRIPTRVRRALRRGLREEPSERFVDLPALLRACRPVSRRRATAVAVGTTATLALGIGLALTPIARGHETPQTPEAVETRATVTLSPADLASVRQAIDDSEASRTEGDAPAALEHAKRAQSLVDARDLEPLRGEVNLALARALEASGQYRESATMLDDAIERALEREDDGLAAQAASELIWIHGTRLHEPTEARRWAKAALLYLERGGDFVDIGAIHYRLGTLATEEGQLDAARDHLEEALAWDHGELAGDDRSIAASTLAISNLDLQQGDVDAAMAGLERTRALLWRTPDDAVLANVYGLLAQISHTRSNHGEALDLFDQALALRRRAGSPYLGYELCNSARVLLSMGRTADARDRSREALSAMEASFGDTSVETTVPLAVLSSALRRLGELEQAERLAWRAVITLESAGREDSPSLAGPLMQVGEIAAERGNVEQAVAHLERSLEIRRRHSVRPTFIAATLISLAEAVARRSVPEALDHAREAVTVLETAGEDASTAHALVARLSRAETSR